MSTNYWDWTCSGATTWGRSSSNLDSSASTWGYTECSNYYRIPQTKKYLVQHPSNWTPEQSIAFVELVNIKTNTGFKAVLSIKDGEILITDPDVDSRTMEEFAPLLRSHANSLDLETINCFFVDNPF